MSLSVLDSPAEVLDVTTAARNRRSIRAYKQEPIPHEDINAILDTVRLAPSPFNIQPWRFVIVENPEVKSKLAAAAYNQRQVTSAPAVIVLYTDMDDVVENVHEVIPPTMDEASGKGIQDAIKNAFPEDIRQAQGAKFGYIALGFLLLAAESRGYQTSSMTGYDPQAIRKLLDLPEKSEIPAIIAIGRGDEEGFPHHRHSVERLAQFV